MQTPEQIMGSNRAAEINRLIEKYESQGMGLLNALQKDNIQNSWGARKKLKKGKNTSKMNLNSKRKLLKLKVQYAFYKLEQGDRLFDEDFHQGINCYKVAFSALNDAVDLGTENLINKYKYKKIACVDFDVHWGNGNYDVMRGNKNSLYISTHQYPFYPGGGTDKDKGDFNNSLNIPLPAGTNSEEYFNAFDRVLERLVRYKPDFLLFSAGFDAHKDDPLAQFELSSKDFYEITKRTLIATNKFTNGKVVSILEGGYDLNALAESANEHVNALLEFC